MWTRAELEIIDRVAAKHDLLVITDEIYEYIRYDGREHISPATVGNLAERTVTIMGLSKTFSITGWRLGYAIAPEHMSPAITLVNDLYYVCSPTPLQHGVAAGFKSPQSYFDDLQTTYQKNVTSFVLPSRKLDLPRSSQRVRTTFYAMLVSWDTTTQSGRYADLERSQSCGRARAQLLSIGAR